MKTNGWAHVWLGIAAAAVLAWTPLMAQAPRVTPIKPPTAESAATIDLASHPAVGAWFGQAMQICPQGSAPVACFNGQPAVSLYMTPLIYPDGSFIGDDTFTVQGPPFGPHSVAVGAWSPSSGTEFSADYVVMMNTYPPSADSSSGIRFRWAAQVISPDTAVGYVNAYLQPAMPLSWQVLGSEQFPPFPREALGMVTPPTGFIKDPTTCRSAAAGCPLVFKFTIKRVRQS